MSDLRIERHITTLIIKHTLQVITPSEQQELNAWREADERHEKAFQWLSNRDNLEKDYRFRQSIDVEYSLQEFKERLESEQTTKVVSLRSRLFNTKLYRVAAVIILLIMGGAFWYHREYTRVTPPEISQEVEYAMETSRTKGWQGAEIITSATPQKQVITEEESARYHVDEDFAEQLAEAKRITTYHNKEYWVTLDDGSLVHLNYDSRLIYPEKFGDRRDVILEGEAYFMVAHDKSRQFVVHTPQGDVAVHGTEFMVNTHGKINTGKKEMSVVLVKGSVGFIPAGGKETIMLPGQELMMVDSQLSINDVDVTPYIAWNTGNFVFDNCPLEQLLEVLARWYGLKVCFIHDDSRNILFTGILSRYAEAKTSLSSIATVADVDITLEENKIIVK